nr:hypothetical protein [Tanacetum cinerariifolium]
VSYVAKADAKKTEKAKDDSKKPEIPPTSSRLSISSVIFFSSSRTLGLVPVPSLEVAKTIVDSSGTLGIIPVPLLKPLVPGYLLLVFLLSIRACIMSAASCSAGVKDSWTYFDAASSYSSSSASANLIDLPNSKAMFRSRIMLSSAKIVTFFLTTLQLAVFFLTGLSSGLDSLDTSTVS